MGCPFYRLCCDLVTGLDGLGFASYGVAAEERRQADVHRTSALKRVRVSVTGAKISRPHRGRDIFGAGDRTRTGTPSLAADFEFCNSFGNPRNLAEFVSI